MLEDQIFKFNQYTQLISVSVKFIWRNFIYKIIKWLFICKGKYKIYINSQTTIIIKLKINEIEKLHSIKYMLRLSRVSIKAS